MVRWPHALARVQTTVENPQQLLKIAQLRAHVTLRCELRWALSGVLWYATLGATLCTAGSAVDALGNAGGPGAEDGTANKTTALPTDQLVRQIVQNEIRAQEADQSRWIYIVRRKAHGREEVYEVIETREGALERCIASGGHQLTPAEQEKEIARIQALVKNPEEFKKKQHEREQDGRQARRLLKLLPEAFLYTYDGKQYGDGKQNKLIGLKFKPNPAYHPASREATVFHHMEGLLLVDAKAKRLAQIDGTLTEDVKFGGGLLGHLEKGGHFTVRQQDVGNGHWDVVSMAVHMKGKALLFKTISVEEEKVQSDFRRAPDDLTLAGAAEMLGKGQLAASKKTPLAAESSTAKVHN
jgi:hypothetical protein